MKITSAILITLLLTLCKFGMCQESKFLNSPNGLLHYKTYGKGYPILIINGGPGMNCEGFSTLAELLSDKYMCILYDQRGTGKSLLDRIDSSTVTLNLMVNDIEQIRKHLKIENWIILGHSFGGWLAQQYATNYPKYLDGMILSASGGIDMSLMEYFGANTDIRLSKEQKDSLAFWSQKINNGDTSHYAKYQRGKALAPAYLYNKKYVQQLAERLTQSKPLITQLVFKDLYKIKYDCKQSLSRFAKPVLIIQGRQDIVGDGTAYKTHISLKNSTLIFINECGHYGWLDQKEIYERELKKFITSVL